MDLRDSRGSLVRAGLVGLVVGAGVCYCVYRATSRKRTNEMGGEAILEGESIQKEHKERVGSTSWGKAQLTTPQQAPIVDVNICSRTGQRHSNHLQQGMNFPVSADGLTTNHIQNLIYLLESVEDPLIQEQVLITLSNSAAFSVNQDIIRNLGGLSVVGSMLSVPAANVKEKALNALNNLSMNIQNQAELKRYINEICEETNSSPLNSELQLSGLRFLTNMSITNDYQYMMTSSIPCFLRLLSDGDERTQTQVLKVLVNLSANPAMTEHLLNAQAPFLLSLFDSCINKEVLLRVLMFATNLTQHMKKEESAVVSCHSEDSIFSMLWGNSTKCSQKLASLVLHHDTEVKEQAAKLITQGTSCQIK
ncbi:armadillo repeat-containing protein 10 isoform X2 [Sphaerodactylus townsendi]|uniref:armadillo repeat-containing protein 10 isoform X2 n=1 Tax=Sphaerodactylus townsendi TaxID=933632 RepID=UPI002026D419|nr:armadillo repeat-containing protein 10 isoform X2 [Sphaerodactylus townsendi]